MTEEQQEFLERVAVNRRRRARTAQAYAKARFELTLLLVEGVALGINRRLLMSRAGITRSMFYRRLRGETVG